MATYYTGNSEIEDDSEATVQTLTLMNPSGYVGFSDTHQPTSSANFVFFNSNSSGNFLSFPHAPSSHEQQQFVGIPLPATTPSAAPSSQHDLTVLHSFLTRPRYSFYNPAVDMTEERENTRAPQGLSLSLSSDQPPGIDNFREAREEVRVSGGSPAASGEFNTGENGVQNHVLLSSKYLKVAQEILEEVVHVGKEVVKSKTESAKAKSNNVGEGGGLSSSSTELSTAERQEIQMKKAKLVTMLDEVEQRYREYYRQMNIVISWFEAAAGIGSAKTYTALALQTISKQFRCLKDAILGQIQAATKSLGEEEILGGKVDGSRLKFVDNQLRQQRALQQLGMIQQHNNAWRPQRGLPERSVSVLRAWLFEHFLHPYPKDSDKSMLAKQTGLTRNQVSNWFINARVRLWKPMVEEMYLEETKEQEQKGLEGKRASKTEQKEDSTSKSIASQPKSPSSESQHETLVSKQDKATENQSCFNLTGTSERGSVNPKKPKTSTEILYSPASVPSINVDVKPSDTKEEQMSIDFGNERQTRDGFTLMGAPTNFMGVFGSYPIEEIQRFNTEQFSTPYSSNGAFSLTLGLPHTDNLNLPMSATHHTFLPTQNIQMVRGLDIGEADDFGEQNTPTSAHPTSVYDNFNIQTRKRFAAQLLPDFVA